MFYFIDLSCRDKVFKKKEDNIAYHYIMFKIIQYIVFKRSMV